MLRKKPGIVPPIGGASLSSDPRERVSAEECRFLPSYLYGPISGVTLAEQQMVLAISLAS
jgi:hypothetical protein